MHWKLHRKSSCLHVILILLLIIQNNAREIQSLDEVAEVALTAIERDYIANAKNCSQQIRIEAKEAIVGDINEEPSENKMEEIYDENTVKIEESTEVKEKELTKSRDEYLLSTPETTLPPPEHTANGTKVDPIKVSENNALFNDEISEVPTDNDELLATTIADPPDEALGQDKQFAGIIDAIAAAIVPTTKQPQRQCPDCECGRINTYRKIVGGQNAVENEYPWMALLQGNGQFFCGGSVINDLYILTAAHCAIRVRPRQLTIRILQYKRETQSMTTIERKSNLIYIYSQYNNKTEDNDIALIRMVEPLKFNNLLRPLCMPERGKGYAGEEGIVTGWGYTKENGTAADVLQEVRVPILTNQQCRMTSYKPSAITDNMMCAGYPTGGMDACQGDSGGPLHVNSNSVYVQPGIVSWGKGCARPNTPGVYTRVNRYLRWIEYFTKDGCYCKQKGKNNDIDLNFNNEK